MCPDDCDHHWNLRLRRRTQQLGAGLVETQDGVVLRASSPWLHHEYLDQDDDYHYNFDRYSQG
jgi:hypothetical protein